MPDLKIKNRVPGKIIFMSDGIPTVVCGTGLLTITSAVDVSGQSIFPLKKFRSRFVSCNQDIFVFIYRYGVSL